jgi:conjugative transfer pilus assembly protein TraH
MIDRADLSSSRLLAPAPNNASMPLLRSAWLRLAAIGVQIVSFAAMLAVFNLVALPLSTTAAQASVAGAMDSYFDDMGAAANVTGPTAFDGQRAGYYSLGNVWTRFPQRTTNLANLQLPSARAGCGGIDLFAGSFSFVNSAEIIALLKSVANNAVGFAFKLAIDTVCPECSKIMEEMRQAAQLMNNANINSCETAQALVGGMWPKSDMADRSICESIGSSTGIFTDWAASKHGCGNQGQRTSTLESVAGNPEWADINTGVSRNYTWHVLKKSQFFAPSGVLDRELAQYVMTMVGTIIYVPAKDNAPGAFNPIEGDTSSSLVTALLDGTTAASPVRIWQCDASEPDDACINPVLTTLTVPASAALRTRVAALLDQMVTATVNDTAVPPAAVELLQVASLPLYKILTVQAAYSRGIANDDRATLAEITSVDLLFAILDQLTGELGKSKSSFIGADQDRIAQWQAQLANARQTLLDRQSNTQVRVSAIMQIVQRTGYIESVLQSSMSPSMSATFDWSRAIGGRGLN